MKLEMIYFYIFFIGYFSGGIFMELYKATLLNNTNYKFNFS